MIIFALGDVPKRVVIGADGSRSRMLSLLDARYASSRKDSYISVKAQLFRISYKGRNMFKYIEQNISFFERPERLGRKTTTPK